MKLIIKNFQAHKALEVEFGPHVTSIVGPSDIGKSAILRALRWVLLNQPLGEAFIREGAKRAEVEWRDGEHRILRVRGAGVNTYEVDGKELEAFGNDLPPEARKLGKVSEINFQSQHDSPYWFGETAGEVSRQLNRIVNLEVIDTTLRNLGTALRKAQTEKTVLAEMLEKDQEQRQGLKYVREMSAEFEDLTALEALPVELQQKSTRLASLIETISEHTRVGESAASCAESGEEACRRMKALIDLQEEQQRLSRLLKTIEVSQEVSARELPDLSELEALKTKWVEVESERDCLDINLRSHRALERTVEEKRESWRSANALLKKMMPNECPLCGQKMC